MAKDKGERWELEDLGKGYYEIIEHSERGQEYICGFDVNSDPSVGIECDADKVLKDAKSIVALHNSAVAIGEPMAVAEGMEDAIKVCKIFAGLGEFSANGAVHIHSPEDEDIKFAQQVVATITKPKEEGD